MKPESITIQLSDKSIDIDKKYAVCIPLIDYYLLEFFSNQEDEQDKATISLPTITSDLFKQVMVYVAHYIDVQQVDKEEMLCGEWDAEFFATSSKKQLFELIEAANFLNYSVLLNKSCHYVANIIRPLSRDAMIDYFGIIDENE